LPLIADVFPELSDPVNKAMIMPVISNAAAIL
jgi:hypothetical protein